MIAHIVLSVNDGVSAGPNLDPVAIMERTVSTTQDGSLFNKEVQLQVIIRVPISIFPFSLDPIRGALRIDHI